MTITYLLIINGSIACGSARMCCTTAVGAGPEWKVIKVQVCVGFSG